MPKAEFTVTTTEGEIQWPRECARCCGTDGLRPVHVGIAKNVTNLGDVALGRGRYRALGVHYLACAQHAGWAAFAGWLTRKSPLPQLVRASAYIFGIPAYLAAVVATVRWMVQVADWYGGRSRVNPWKVSAPDDWFGALFFFLFLAACAVLLVLVPLAYRRAPVRLLKLDTDSIVVRFSNERYARHFARANPDIAEQRP